MNKQKEEQKENRKSILWQEDVKLREKAMNESFILIISWRFEPTI